MASLILTSDVLSVRLESRRLEVVRRAGDGPSTPREKYTVPLHDLDRVVAVGQPSITIPVLTRTKAASRRNQVEFINMR